MKKEKEICTGFVVVPQTGEFVAKCLVQMENAPNYRASCYLWLSAAPSGLGTESVWIGGSGAWFPETLASSSSVEIILVRKTGWGQTAWSQPPAAVFIVPGRK